MPDNNLAPKGRIACFSGASGCGKSTIIKALLERRPDIFYLAPNLTTRAPRDTDLAGEYQYVDRTTIESMRGGHLLAWCLDVHGNYYATPTRAIMDAFSDDKGRVSLFNVTPETVVLLRNTIITSGAGLDRLTPIYILSPPAEELRSRIEKRGGTPEHEIVRRLKECAQWDGQASLDAHTLGYRFLTNNEGEMESAIGQTLKILGIGA